MAKQIVSANITDILPMPFEWVEIPAGDVTLVDLGGYLSQPTTFSVAPFAMSKYPITNAQFAVFASAEDGYCDMAWWDFSDSAREWRYEHDIPKPIEFGGDHPRTHVTWYEAVAFCHWLSAKTKTTIRLPSEQEWQRAAQGDDNRAYPWGNNWDDDACHHNLKHQNIGTEPVSQYDGTGDSPFGVVDMVGNVWEWCLTNWATGDIEISSDAVRVLRGGSWFDDVYSAYKVTKRASWNAEIRSDLRGFRVVQL